MDQDKVKIGNNTEKNGRDNEISMMRLNSMKKESTASQKIFAGFNSCDFSRICKNKSQQKKTFFLQLFTPE